MIKKEEEFSERLKFALREKNLAQFELANKTDISQQLISDYVRGRYKPSLERIKLIANVLKVSPAWLMGLDVPMQLESPTIVSMDFNDEDMIKMPVLGRIPAGVPIEAIEDIDTYLYIHKDRVKETPEDYFLLKIDGDSMSPKYENEDVILFEKSSTANNGQDVAIMVNGYDATFKTIYRYEDRVELKPINQQYQVQVFNNKEIEELPITILGIAKSLEYRKL